MTFPDLEVLPSWVGVFHDLEPLEDPKRGQPHRPDVLAECCKMSEESAGINDYMHFGSRLVCHDSTGEIVSNWL